MIKILIFTLFSFGSGGAIFAFLSKNWYFLRFCFLYALIFSVALIVGNKYAVFLLYAAISMYVIKNEPNNIVYYYLVMLSAFPINVDLIVGVPGVDTLFIFNHARILILFLFLPSLFKIISTEKKIFGDLASPVGLIDRAFFLYVALEVVLFFRDLSFTSSIRSSIHIFIDVWVPYFVISRSLKNVNAFLLVLLFSAIVMSVVAIVETTFFLRVYDSIMLKMGEGTPQRYVRGGGLRVYASMSNPLALGLFLSLSLLIAFKVRDLINCAWYTPWILTLIILMGIEASGSRSPIATNIVAVLILFWWSLGRHTVKKTAGIVLLIFCLFAYWLFAYGMDWLASFDTSGEGNFYYRYDLLLNSSDAIKNNLWFGSDDYWSNEMLLHSFQGQGIIDITNTYLGVLLNMGLVGLSIFICIWVLVLRGLYCVSGPEKTASLLMAITVNTMLMIFICSPVLTIPNYFWMLVAVIVAFFRLNIERTH